MSTRSYSSTIFWWRSVCRSWPSSRTRALRLGSRAILSTPSWPSRCTSRATLVEPVPRRFLTTKPPGQTILGTRLKRIDQLFQGGRGELLLDILQEVEELPHRGQAVLHRGAGAELDEVLQFPPGPVHNLGDAQTVAEPTFLVQCLDARGWRAS